MSAVKYPPSCSGDFILTENAKGDIMKQFVVLGSLGFVMVIGLFGDARADVTPPPADKTKVEIDSATITKLPDGTYKVVVNGNCTFRDNHSRGGWLKEVGWKKNGSPGTIAVLTKRIAPGRAKDGCMGIAGRVSVVDPANVLCA